MCLDVPQIEITGMNTVQRGNYDGMIDKGPQQHY